MRITTYLISSLAVILLSGCSPHPGSGVWLTDDPSSSEFQRLSIQFDGRAEFFKPGEESAAVRCFWSGDNAQSIALDCIDAADTDVKYQYQLTVMEPDQGQLLLMGKLAGRYHRSDQEP